MKVDTTVLGKSRDVSHGLALLNIGFSNDAHICHNISMLFSPWSLLTCCRSVPPELWVQASNIVCIADQKCWGDAQYVLN